MKGTKEEDLIYDYLINIDKPFTLSDIYKKIEVTETKSLSRKIISTIIDGSNFVAEDDVFYPKIYFLKDIPFRILPTEFEIQNNILILGHRIIPFQPVFETVDSVSLINNGKMIQKREEKFKIKQISIYFSLLDIERLPIKNLKSILEPNADLKIDVFDLKKFYKENNFKAGDTIIARSNNFKEGLFNIEYDSSENFKDNIFNVKFMDNLFLNELKKILKLKLSFPNIEKQLLYTYYYLRDNDITIPGSAFGLFLNQNKEIIFSEVLNGIKILHMADQDVNEMNIYPDFEDYKKEIDEEDYDLNTIDGILGYLYNSNREIVVRALIFDQITHKEYNYNKIINYLFYDLESPYMPEKLKNKFKKLVDSLYNEIKNKIQKYPPSLPVITARKKILNILLEIAKFLRSFDKHEINFEDLPKNDMYNIMQMSKGLEDVLMAAEEIQESNEIKFFLEMVQEAEKNIPIILHKVKSEILESQ